MFELDFSEKEIGISMSREDIKFYDTVETGIVHRSRTCTMKCPSLSNIRNQKSEIGNRKSEIGNGKWEMGNGKWEMGNGK